MVTMVVFYGGYFRKEIDKQYGSSTSTYFTLFWDLKDHPMRRKRCSSLMVTALVFGSSDSRF